MSVADLYDLELTWPSPGPKEVIVTGTFDQWTASTRLVKGDTGFFGTVKVPWGQKIAYKYIVDGSWQCRDDRPKENDEHGNTNNTLRTPEKPPVVPSLFIPSGDTPGHGHGDAEIMVTALEFLPPADYTTIKGTLPAPQLAVDGLDQAPPVGTPIDEATLDTAVMTEGATLSLKLPEGHMAPDPPILVVNDNTFLSLPPASEDDPHSFAIHAPIQSTTGESSTSPVPETSKEGIPAPLESPVPSDQTPQAVAAPTDQASDPPASAHAASVVLEPMAKKVEEDLLGIPEANSRQQNAASAIGQAPTPASSTVSHKKRRSLLAIIKHIFHKDDDNRQRKERKKH